MKNKNYEDTHIKNKELIEKTITGYEFIDCEFENFKFENIEILHTSFINCKFNNCTIFNIQAHNCEVKNSEFLKCNVISLDWNKFLPSRNITNPIYKLENCFLKHNNFINLTFAKFNFSNNTIIESLFGSYYFTKCKLENTNIINSNISKSDFRHSTDYIISTLNNKIKGAKFSFPKVVNLLNDLELKIDY